MKRTNDERNVVRAIRLAVRDFAEDDGAELTSAQVARIERELARDVRRTIKTTRRIG